MNNSQVPVKEDPEKIEFAQSLVLSLREPVAVISDQGKFLAANNSFCQLFENSDNFYGKDLKEICGERGMKSGIEEVLKILSASNTSVKNFPVVFSSSNAKKHRFEVSGNIIPWNKSEKPLFLIAFKQAGISAEKKSNYRQLLDKILSQAPAIICIVRGPNHVFELANDRYLELLEYRDIINKPCKEALPEAEQQGFIKILDEVYRSGKPFIGKELSFSLKRDGGKKEIFLDFVYQPLRDASGNVEGIFVHAVDVTEKVENRQVLENNEKVLRNLVNTLPVIVWITNAFGQSYYLNKNGYDYLGKTEADSLGADWQDAVHPDDRDRVKAEFLRAHEEQKDYEVKFRLRNRSGEYRWVIDRGRPKWDSGGTFEGLIGTVTDVHENELKENLIREKEHRTRTIVEQATVATAVYTGQDMKVELANDAMLNLWGKDRSVIGATLREALPELEGQPFHDLLQKVYTTGEIYWGKEDRADLMRNGKMETGFFNFTYKPLRNEKGEIYGILNMALDVTEMVESKNLLKERERHFSLMADLMPEKVTNTDAKGKAVYFNQNWLEYTGLSGKELIHQNWKSFVHPEDKELFEEKWNYSLATGAEFEMELRLRDRNENYMWHLSRAEAVKGEQGEVKMWICTNTEIQRLKEEEKRKEDFLKMVSHELKTPITSIKGYVQLLLNLMDNNKVKVPAAFPLKPSLERIDNQIVRLTRLISEILDLSRLEENKLELKKEVFDLNHLVEQTVQDIKLTNTQHHMRIFHTHRTRVFADKDRIGQVLINFITNAIKYSPESHHIEIHILKEEEDKVAVSIRDKGIGIEEKFHSNIFKRFYRIGVEGEETYAGFGIGLYLANEVIERHDGYIRLESKKGEGSNFTFVLHENNMKNGE